MMQCENGKARTDTRRLRLRHRYAARTRVRTNGLVVQNYGTTARGSMLSQKSATLSKICKLVTPEPKHVRHGRVVLRYWLSSLNIAPSCTSRR